MIFTKTQLKCGLNYKDQVCAMLHFFHCSVRRQITVHIHKLKMLIGERGKRGAKWTWIHGRFSLCTDYIQNLLLLWDLPERAPPEKIRENRNLEIIICWRRERFLICHEPTILKAKLVGQRHINGFILLYHKSNTYPHTRALWGLNRVDNAQPTYVVHILNCFIWRMGAARIKLKTNGS